jgi:DNA polymerase III subunit beta
VEATIATGALKLALECCTAVSTKKAKVPNADGVLLKVTHGLIRCMSTDLHTCITVDVPATDTDDGATVVPADRLLQIVKGIDRPEIHVQLAKEVLAVKAGKARYRIISFPARNFPVIPEPVKDGMEIDFPALAAALEGSAYAASRDTARLHLSGVYYESAGDRAMFTATDGHRLVHVQQEMEGPVWEQGIILHARAARCIGTVFAGHPTVRIARDDRRLHLSSDTYHLSSAIVDARFPPYQQVIPDPAVSVEVAREALLETVQRMALIGPAITLRGEDDVLYFSASNPQLGEASEEVACEGAKDITIGFATKLMIDALRHFCGDTVQLGFSDEHDPVRIDDGENIAVIMPLRM